MFWITFRLHQAVRLLHAAGLGLLVLLLVITAGLWLKVLTLFFEAPDWGIAAMVHAAVAWLHGQRRDMTFLRQSIRPIWQFALTDYVLLLSPLCLLLLFSERYMALPGVLTAILWAFAPMRNPDQTQRAKPLFSLNLLPVQAYEWFFVVRTQWPLLILGLLFFGATVFHFGFFIAGCFVGLICLPPGFTHLAPASMQATTRHSLLRRWRLLAKPMHLFLLPGYLILCFFQTAYWPLGLYAAFAFESFLLLCYTGSVLAWQPERRRIYSDSLHSILLLLSLIPGGILVVAGLAAWRLIQVYKRY
jgi:hypothetical protein